MCACQNLASNTSLTDVAQDLTLHYHLSLLKKAWSQNLKSKLS